MKVASRVFLVGLVSLTLLGLPLLPDTPLRALDVDERRVSLAFAADEGGAWISAPIEGDHTIAGLTWEDPANAPSQTEVRLRVDGQWGDWEELHTDDEHAPDPGSREDEDARGGTSPIVIKGAEALQFRVSDGSPPTDLAADLVTVGDPDADKRVRERPSAAGAVPARPTIHTRSDWGGDSCPGREPSEYVEYADQVQVMFVHHTAGHTSYAKSDVPSIIRAICSYHVNSRGWDDIGYNALIDRYGGIWEGRAGGIDKGVRGAHTGGFNNDSTGVAFIGDHHNGGAPTGDAQRALARYAAWKLDVHNVNPGGTSVLTSAGSSRWAEGRNVTLDNISGHRDASYTACPGNSCYVLLDNFRQEVDALGGFRTFGGWAQKRTMDLKPDGTWEHPVIGFRFTDPARWTFELRDRTGQLVLRREGESSGPEYVEWDAEMDGRPAPQGSYSIHVTATRVSDGRAATPADHVVELGGTLGEFDDVPGGHRFHDDIKWLAVQGITKGCNPPQNARFCPDGTVTRGQMAAFLTRALNLPATSEADFLDVPASHRFHDDINRLAAAGITRGCNATNDRFCPDDPVRRDQMAAFLVRAYGFTAMSHPGFRDVPAGSTFDRDIRHLATAAVTHGCNAANDRYCPGDAVTRAQMAAFLRRAATS